MTDPEILSAAIEALGAENDELQEALRIANRRLKWYYSKTGNWIRKVHRLRKELAQLKQNHAAEMELASKLAHGLAADRDSLLIQLHTAKQERDAARELVRKAHSGSAQLAKDRVEICAPAARGENVLKYAKPGPVGLGSVQRAELLRQLEKLESDLGWTLHINRELRESQVRLTAELRRLQTAAPALAPTFAGAAPACPWCRRP